MDRVHVVVIKHICEHTGLRVPAMRALTQYKQSDSKTIISSACTSTWTSGVMEAAGERWLEGLARQTAYCGFFLVFDSPWLLKRVLGAISSIATCSRSTAAAHAVIQM